MLRPPLAYRAALRLAVLGLPVFRPLSGKLAIGDRERRAALARWENWARTERDRSRPLLWCHAPSVGEGRQAEAVLRLLRDRHPTWQIVYTFFSPSAAGLATRLPADRADYLPYDTPAAAHRMLGALAPTALVFTKLDLWPELATAARARGVAVGLVAATVSPLSGRRRWPARALTRSGYGALVEAGAIASDHAERLASLGTSPDRITVTGDPAFDSASRRARAVDPADPLLEWGRDALTLVAGSTWPADEAVVLPAFAAVRARHPSARLVLVPHEPTPGHLAATTARAAGLALPVPARLSAARPPVPFLLVDRVGALATLYHAATVAYVGGGFGRAGLHSVLEPAAAGRPVIVGPRWQTSHEAGLLLDAGGAIALPRGRRAVDALAAAWERWLVDDRHRETAGGAAFGVVTAGLGADLGNAALVERLMAANGPR